MRPDSAPSVLNFETPSTGHDKYKRVMPNAVNCPKGSVPIRRTRKEDLIRAKSFSESFATTTRPLTGLTRGLHLAIVRSKPDPKIRYRGIEAQFNVYNPVADSYQSSSGQMWIQNGARGVVNSIQAGWMVAPWIYDDNTTRIFIYWTANGKRGCFNQLCEGFIHTHSKYPLGVPIETSKYGAHTQKELHIRIYQDPNTGNWWLYLPYKKAVAVGYWPKELFPLLVRGATQVTWGGAVESPWNKTSPQMGSGIYPNKNDTRRGSYFRQMLVVDSDNRLVEPAAPCYQLESVVDPPRSKCYGLENYGYVKEFRMGYSFLYGGPGGDCGF